MIFGSFVTWPLVCNICNICLYFTPNTPCQLLTSSAVEYQSLISFRRILSRSHLFWRLEQRFLNAWNIFNTATMAQQCWCCSSRNTVMCILAEEWWCLKVHVVHLGCFLFCHINWLETSGIIKTKWDDIFSKRIKRPFTFPPKFWQFFWQSRTGNENNWKWNGNDRPRGGEGGTWVFFGWVCAVRDFKLAPRSKKLSPKIDTPF